MTTLKIGAQLQAARERCGKLQRDLGAEVHLSPKTVSAIETNRRRVPRDVKPAYARAIDQPEAYLALAADANGGVLVPAWLDGPAADLSPAVVAGRTDEEIAEAQAARAEIRRIILRARAGEPLNDLDRQRVKRALLEDYDAWQALATEIAINARLCGISLAELATEHRQKLLARGYMKGRR
ncbi:MAG: helix-turn-helix domain-containing protein [Bacillota bacterium]